MKQTTVDVSSNAEQVMRQTPPRVLREVPGIAPGDPMSEAGRKVMRYHFERMLYHEPDTRLGADIEALHDMRVATRRMRAAFRVFDSFYEPQAVKPHIKGLRATGRALGAVRDLDVFIEKLGCYRDTLPASERGGAVLLLDAWAARRAQERTRMLCYLDGPRYAQFVDAFAAFLTAGDARSHRPPHGYLVRHVVPRLIYARLEAVRSYDALLDGAPVETLHALRIEFKRFRYTLEFFQEVLGHEVQSVIKAVKVIQDHLGDLNDAEVAGRTLQDFIADAGTGLHLAVPVYVDEIARYVAYRAAERRHLMDTFPAAWANFNRDAVRRALAAAVSAL